jgi:septal ring factor EnvC (AmiA/AmiB activator)
VNDPLECQRRLAQRIEEQLTLRPIDREELVKQLIVSPKQLQALLAAEPEQFHTYGIYLRALTRLIALTGLADDPRTQQDLECLEQYYAKSPRGSDIRRVRDTINRMLGEAPAEPSAHVPSKGALTVILLVFFVVLGGVAIAFSR